jgi:hypothetical protein
MKTKQIDYGIAENGLEAVEKWRTGNYHLVLVSQQYVSTASRFEPFTRWIYKCPSWTA